MDRALELILQGVYVLGAAVAFILLLFGVAILTEIFLLWSGIFERDYDEEENEEEEEHGEEEEIRSGKE